MHHAAARGDVAEVRRLVAAGADLEKHGEDGGTPLFWAAVNGRVETVTVLVQLGADMKAQAARAWTALHLAAAKGHVKMVEVLVQLGADKDAKAARGETPLHRAACNGHVEAVTVLVQLGADKDAMSASGRRPLHWAAGNGHAEVVQALVQLGAHTEAKNAAGATALQVEFAAATKAAAERQKMEHELAAITLRVQSDVLRLQQVQAQLGSSSVVPPAAPQDEEKLCVLCLDAPKDHIIIPCGHQCVCRACAEKLKKARSPLCPFCRTPIHATCKVFVV